MASRSSGSRLFALIIGIDDYPPECGLGTIKCAVRDADTIRNWLINNFNVPPSHIRDLRNKVARRKAIIQALDDLSTNLEIEQDDPILIYYAGHGSQAQAPKQWQSPSKIQMIVPWDFNQPDGPNDVVEGIPDHTLGVLLARLAERKGNNVTVIFDCSHSGSGTRTHWDSHLNNKLGRPTNREARVSGKFRPDGLRSHVLLAACASDECAHENRHLGAFTEALVRALDRANPTEITYEDLMDGMETLSRQTPQCEGYFRGRFLFDRNVANPKPFWDATLRRNQLSIAAGSIDGIPLGSKFAIRESRHSDPLAVVTIERVEGNRSLATLNIAALEMGTLPRRVLAQIEEIPHPELLIHVPEVIQSMDCFKNVFSENRRPLSIRVVNDKALATIGLNYLDELDKIGFEMPNSTEHGQEIRCAINPTAEELHRALDHLCHYYYNRDRVNPVGPIVGEIPFSHKFTFKMFALREGENGNYVPSGPNLNIQGTGIELSLGSHNEDIYGFEITNDCLFPVFPYLFYFDGSNFSITPIYQPEDMGGKRAPNRSIPAQSTLTIGYGSAGTAPHNLEISDKNLDLEQGVQYQGWPRAIWDVITVPVVLKRDQEPPPFRMIGFIGSRRNGKNAFLKELSISLDGGAILKPTLRNAVIKEYDVTLPGPDQKSLILVDLPAFEDNNIDNNCFVLKAMVTYLANQYQSGRRFASLIWCYNISKPRLTVVDGQNLNLLKDISGPDALKNVVVLTTNWNKGAEVVVNAATADFRTMAPPVSPLQEYETTETQLKPLFGGEVRFSRFGTFFGSAARESMLGSASAGDPLELIRSLLANDDVALQVQREACETRILAETTAGKTLEKRLEAEIKKREKEIRGLRDELDELDEHDKDRNAIHEEKIDAEQDILRWRKTLEDMKVPLSDFIS